MARGACVYIAHACKSELDSGSDFQSYYFKENYDHETLGMFFTLARANQCAKNYVENELGYDLVDEEAEMEDEEENDYEFIFDSSER